MRLGQTERLAPWNHVIIVIERMSILEEIEFFVDNLPVRIHSIIEIISVLLKHIEVDRWGVPG